MVVSKPLSVARNGGEVSVGGQHNILVSVSSEAVKLASFDIFFTSGVSKVIEKFVISTQVT